MLTPLVSALTLVPLAGDNCALDPRPVNLGLASKTFDVGGEIVVFQVREQQQGAVDLNGDGDTKDEIATVFDWRTGALVSSGMAALKIGGGTFGYELFEAHGERAAFLALEVGQQMDLNGDGDMSDRVLHVYERALGTFVNSGIAACKFDLLDGGLWVSVSELSQGETDLNGDGDTDDTVLFFGRSATDLAVLERSSFTCSTGQPPIAVGDRAVAYAASEAAFGNIDLNGDGDADDAVAHLLLLGTGTTVNLELALVGGFTQPGSLGYVGERGLLLAANEVAQGADLNGDGILTSVAVLVDLPTLTPRVLDLAFSGGFVSDGDRVVFESNETVDLNGDDDLGDQVYFVYDAETGAGANLGLASSSGRDALVSGEAVYLQVSEESQGVSDLNADGEVGHVAFVHSFATGATELIEGQVDPDDPYGWVGGSLVAYYVHESAAFVTPVDLNGDGDFEDNVLHLWDAETGIEHNSGVACSYSDVVVANGRAYFDAWELQQGNTDLNGDGDASDMPLFVFEPGGVAQCVPIDPVGLIQVEGTRGAALLRESTDGVDYNGDGDEGDTVLHLLSLP